MRLNVGKCEVISFSRARPSNRLQTSYSINQEPLRRVLVVRDLGVWLNTRMDFRAHVDHLASRGRMLLGFVKRQAKEFQCPYVTKALFCSLVRSVLEYCSVVWSPGTSGDCTRIESVQKQFLLFALRALGWPDPFALPPYHDRLQLLHLQTLEGRRRLAAALFVFDVLRGRLDVPALAQRLRFKPLTRNTRYQAGPRRLEVPVHSTNYERNSPLVRSSLIFNRHADCYDGDCSRETFRARLLQRPDFR